MTITSHAALVSRRRFTVLAGSAAAIALSRSAFGRAASGLTLGLNTWSLRSLSQNEAIPIIVRVMKQTGLDSCELLFSHVEPAHLSPVFPVGLLDAPWSAPTPEQLEQQRATAAALKQWRLSTPMSYFETIRSAFTEQGLRIRSFAARLGSSEEEVDQLFRMARALGVDSVNVRLPETMTRVLAAAAERHGMLVGLQGSDLTLLTAQLSACRYFRLDTDIGDLTKARMDALAFVKAQYRSILSLDLKDAKTGGASVPFGEGDATMTQVVHFLQQRQVPLTAYIDCDYAGTGRSAEEIARCISFVRRAMA